MLCGFWQERWRGGWFFYDEEEEEAMGGWRVHIRCLYIYSAFRPVQNDSSIAIVPFVVKRVLLMFNSIQDPNARALGV